MMASFSH